MRARIIAGLLISVLMSVVSVEAHQTTFTNRCECEIVADFSYGTNFGVWQLLEKGDKVQKKGPEHKRVCGESHPKWNSEIERCVLAEVMGKHRQSESIDLKPGQSVTIGFEGFTYPYGGSVNGVGVFHFRANPKDPSLCTGEVVDRAELFKAAGYHQRVPAFVVGSSDIYPKSQLVVVPDHHAEEEKGRIILVLGESCHSIVATPFGKIRFEEEGEMTEGDFRLHNGVKKTIWPGEVGAQLRLHTVGEDMGCTGGSRFQDLPFPDKGGVEPIEITGFVRASGVLPQDATHIKLVNQTGCTVAITAAARGGVGAERDGTVGFEYKPNLSTDRYRSAYFWGDVAVVAAKPAYPNLCEGKFSTSIKAALGVVEIRVTGIERKPEEKEESE